MAHLCHWHRLRWANNRSFPLLVLFRRHTMGGGKKVGIVFGEAKIAAIELDHCKRSKIQAVTLVADEEENVPFGKDLMELENGSWGQICCQNRETAEGCRERITKERNEWMTLWQAGSATNQPTTVAVTKGGGRDGQLLLPMNQNNNNSSSNIRAAQHTKFSSASVPLAARRSRLIQFICCCHRWHIASSSSNDGSGKTRRRRKRKRCACCCRCCLGGWFARMN